MAVGISNHDGSQTLPLEYTISSADTWEKKILTVPARTLIGTCRRLLVHQNLWV